MNIEKKKNDAVSLNFRQVDIGLTDSFYFLYITKSLYFLHFRGRRGNFRTYFRFSLPKINNINIDISFKKTVTG